MCLPTLDQGPGVVLLVPDLETVVRTGRDHAGAKIVEVDSEHKVLVAVRKRREAALCGHGGVDTARAHKRFLEVFGNVLLNAAGVTVGTGLLNQRRD